MTTTIVILVALVLPVVVAAILIRATTKPATFRVERTTSIQAPPERIFSLIDDFRAWGAWSPWEKRDPAMQRTYSGAAAGKGAVYEWEGNKNVGTGRMEIADTSAPSRVVINLHFMKPFEAKNTAEFMLRPVNGSTVVTWAMYGPNLFAGKVKGTFMNMDEMFGNDFEAGLTNMKAAAEKEAGTA
jgi:uncharacterized protein YndB with AHSA1/START domain